MINTVRRRLGLVVAAGATALVSVATPVTAHAAGTLSLLTQPTQGHSAVYSFINSATRTIDVTMYELRDTTVTHRPGETARRQVSRFG